MNKYSAIRFEGLPINGNQFVYLGTMKTELKDKNEIEEAVKEIVDVLFSNKTLKLNFYDASGVGSLFRAENFAAFRILPMAE